MAFNVFLETLVRTEILLTFILLWHCASLHMICVETKTPKILIYSQITFTNIDS